MCSVLLAPCVNPIAVKYTSYIHERWLAQITTGDIACDRRSEGKELQFRHGTSTVVTAILLFLNRSWEMPQPIVVSIAVLH
jgi:hypothetical protein